MEEVVIIPSSALAARFDPDFPCRILFYEAQGKSAENGQVRCTMSFSDSAVILSESYIEAPMQTVFNTPVPSDSLRKADGIIGQTGNEIACVFSNTVSKIPLGFSHPEAGESGPFGFVLKPVHISDGGVSASLNSAVAAIDGGMGVVRKVLVVVLPGFLEEQFHFFVENALVALEGENIITSLLRDLLGDFLLATHGIDGYDTAFDIQDLEQLGDCGDFVGLCVSGKSAQGRFFSVAGDFSQSGQRSALQQGHRTGSVVPGETADR